MSSLLRWLYPGMGVKRWLSLSIGGGVVFAFGLFLSIRVRWATWIDTHVSRPVNDFWRHFTPIWIPHVLLMAAGLVLVFIGLQRWFNTIYRAVRPFGSRHLVDVMYERLEVANGSDVVAIGGGTGLSSLLRGLKHKTSNITAVVAVSDDGGSSGRLRKELGLLPPGDIRNCLVALADDDLMLSELFQYRFSEGGELSGHSFGNLFLAAMTEIAGDFDKAVQLSSKILAIRGRVLPGTLHQAALCAEFIDGTVVEGESRITAARKKIRRVWLTSDCEAMPEVLKSIAQADAILLGPGSLYTSVLPNLLVRGVVDALAETKGLRIYVCNVMTQPGETDGYTASDHLKAIFRHAGRRIVDVALVNSAVPSKLLEQYEAKGAYPVEPDLDEIRRIGVRPVAASLINETDLVRHDPERLAGAVGQIMISHLATGDSAQRRKMAWLSRRPRRERISSRTPRRVAEVPLVANQAHDGRDV